MKSFFRNWRKDSLRDIRKYILYGLGEVLLIIIGILIAVNINQRQESKKDNILRCQYLEELKFSINQDIKDIEENIDLFEDRIPKIDAIIQAIENQALSEVDSVDDKIDALLGYVYFVQQSKSKIEELKYSTVNLIENRTLKNEVLLYQESKVGPLLRNEKLFFRNHDKVVEYFETKFGNIDLEELQADAHFNYVVTQKLHSSKSIKQNYEYFLEDLNEIKTLIDIEWNNKCRKN